MIKKKIMKNTIKIEKNMTMINNTKIILKICLKAKKNTNTLERDRKIKNNIADQNRKNLNNKNYLKNKIKINQNLLSKS